MNAIKLPLNEQLLCFYVAREKKYESFFLCVIHIMIVVESHGYLLHKHIYIYIDGEKKINFMHIFNELLETESTTLQFTHLANAFLNFTNNVSSTIRLFISNKIMLCAVKKFLSLFQRENSTPIMGNCAN